MVLFCNQVNQSKERVEVKRCIICMKLQEGSIATQVKRSLQKNTHTILSAKKVEAVVYAGLSDEQALRLALRHNVNSHFMHKMTFRDLVSNHKHIALILEHSML